MREQGKLVRKKKKKKSKEMRVVNVIDHMGLGGAQTIMKKLIEKNKNHYLFAIRKAPNEIKFSPKDSKRVKILTSRFKLNLYSVIELRNFIRENNIDIVHPHLPNSIFMTYLYKVLLPNKTKVIVSEHAAVFSDKKKFYRFILRRLERYATCFIGVSQITCDALINKAGIRKDKVELIYNYIDFDDVKKIGAVKREKLRDSFGLRDIDFVFGFAGRLAGVKRIDTLIDAFAKMRDNNTKLLIIGDGPLREELSDRAGEGVMFLGFRKDIGELYQILDSIVLPSNTEASPMTFYETQVYGIPFIGSDIDVICEFIKHEENGLIFRLGNSDELADRMKRIRDDDKLRKQISRKALQGLNKYDFKLYMKRLNEIYEK